MRAYTDYPITWLGDIGGEEAPIREVEVVSSCGWMAKCVNVDCGYKVRYWPNREIVN